MEADTSISKPDLDLTRTLQTRSVNKSARKAGIKMDSVIIDVDYYADKAAGKRKVVESEVIDVDPRAIKDMNVIDVDSYSKREIIDLDSDEDHDTDATNKSRNEEIIDLDSDSRYSWEQVKEDDDDEDVILVREAKKAKLVTLIKRAAVLSDQWLPDHIKNNYFIIEVGGEIYDAMLTRTNFEDNINEFYVIQVLKANDDQSYMVYSRWGTVGQKGKIMLSGPLFSCDSAIREFKEKFHGKTNNYWSNRRNFVSYPMCYTWLELDYSKKDLGKTSVPRPARRVLDPRVAKFISLICNIQMMTQQMTDIGYDAEKLPLKNLSKATILKGYDVLQLISDAIMGQPNRKLLEDLSGEFYTIIPHDFGNKKLSDFVIDTPQKLKSKLDMVEALGEIEHAAAFLAIDVQMQEDPLYTRYLQLHCDLVPVDATSKEFKMIENYIRDSYAGCNATNPYGFPATPAYPYAYAQPTPAPVVLPQIEVFRVSREGETARFRKHAGTKNRMLLWHGSSLTNWASILSQGLRIASVARGGTFGKGIYFADMFIKSLTYCHISAPANTAVLLLCEVALGEIQEHGQGFRSSMGKQSVKGVGMMAPSRIQVLEDGVIVPTGPVQPAQGRLGYNEYIVYKEDQVRMRYVVKVKYGN